MTANYLAILLPDSNSKIVCNHIHLLLPLNQIQHLIVKDILNYVIKNKEKMYLDFSQ